MVKKVTWIVTEEEFSIGFSGDVFITEEVVRFDSPVVTLHDSLYEAVKWVLNYNEDDANTDEAQEFRNQLVHAREAYVESKKKIVIRQFMKKMDEKFSEYKNNGIMESYRCDLEKCEMWISEEDDSADHIYMWAALDGAAFLWNEQCAPYNVYVVEYTADNNGMRKFEFVCELN